MNFLIRNSKFFRRIRLFNYKIKYNALSLYARVVELVDTRDLKSLASNGVPVQVRLRVPQLKF